MAMWPVVITLGEAGDRGIVQKRGTLGDVSGDDMGCAVGLFRFQMALWQRGQQAPGSAGKLRRCRQVLIFLFPSCMTLAHLLAFLTFSFLIYKIEKVRPGDLRYSLEFGILKSSLPRFYAQVESVPQDCHPCPLCLIFSKEPPSCGA